MISYLQVFKATSFFGGVQVINIVIAVIRSKFIAIFLGPAGMGIFDLLTSTINLIGGCTSFGLGSSAIRDISAANATSDEKKIVTTVVVIKRLVWFTGSLGFLIALLLSPWLSFVAFKTYEYALSFAWVSVTLLFSQLTTGQLVVLQGLRKHKYLALAGIIGNFIGAIFSILLYYFYSINGIVPAIISSSLISMFVAWYYSNISFKASCQINNRDVFKIGKNMLQMGFYISLSWLLSIIFSYFIRIFISQTGGVVDLGLYGAGFALINTYVGLILKQ
jgi:O-antigen/teichoic acid export membrane protein